MMFWEHTPRTRCTARTAPPSWLTRLCHPTRVARRSICSRERALFSVCFFGSMATTLYASLVIHSYFATVAASGVEMAALFWYLASYVPGGKTGMMMFTSMFFKTVRALAGPCFAAIKVSCAGCLKLAGRSSS